MFAGLGITVAGLAERPDRGGVLTLDVDGTPLQIALLPWLARQHVLRAEQLMDLEGGEGTQEYATRPGPHGRPPVGGVHAAVRERGRGPRLCEGRHPRRRRASRATGRRVLRGTTIVPAVGHLRRAGSPASPPIDPGVAGARLVLRFADPGRLRRRRRSTRRVARRRRTRAAAERGVHRPHHAGDACDDPRSARRAGGEGRRGRGRPRQGVRGGAASSGPRRRRSRGGAERGRRHRCRGRPRSAAPRKLASDAADRTTRAPRELFGDYLDQSGAARDPQLLALFDELHDLAVTS